MKYLNYTDNDDGSVTIKLTPPQGIIKCPKCQANVVAGQLHLHDREKH